MLSLQHQSIRCSSATVSQEPVAYVTPTHICKCQHNPRSKTARTQLARAGRPAITVCLASQVHAAAAQLATGPELDLAKMEPLGDRILVKPDEEASTTEGGIIVSPTASKGMGIQDAVIGEVLAVGNEVTINTKKGDKVLYSKYSTSDVSVPDGDVTFVAQKSVLATLS